MSDYDLKYNDPREIKESKLVREVVYKGAIYKIYSMPFSEFVIDVTVGDKKYKAYSKFRFDWIGEKTNTVFKVRCYIDYHLPDFCNEKTIDKYKACIPVIKEVLSHSIYDDKEVYYNREFDIPRKPSLNQCIRLPEGNSHNINNWGDDFIEAIRLTIAYAVAVNIEMSLLNRMGYVKKVMLRVRNEKKEKMNFVRMGVWALKIAALVTGTKLLLGDDKVDINADIPDVLPDLPDMPDVNIDLGSGTPMARIDYSEALIMPNVSNELYSEIDVYNMTDSMFADSHIPEIQNGDSGDQLSFTGREPDMSYYNDKIDQYSRELEQATADVSNADGPEELEEAEKRQQKAKRDLEFWKDARFSVHNETKQRYIKSDCIMEMHNIVDRNMKEIIADLDNKWALKS